MLYERSERASDSPFVKSITRPVTSVNEEGDELLCISFKPGIFTPFLPPRELRDKGLLLHQRNLRSFELVSESFEIPTFENADDFIARLSGAGLLVKDDLVEAALSGDPKAASVRSLQRHFIASTGLTLNFYRQLERAHRAEQLLRAGRPAVDVALDLGVTDQSHMINSLKAILGRIPSQIIRTRPTE